MRTADLYELHQRKWKHGEDRNVIDNYGQLWMGDTRSSAQVHLWTKTSESNECTFNVILPGQHVWSHCCWVSPDGQGANDGDGRDRTKPIPDEAVDILAHAEPLPRPDSLYGFTQGGRVVALYHIWDSEDDFDLHCAPYVLAGATEPALFTGTGQQRHMDLRAWWAAVDAGELKRIEHDIAQSTQPIEMRKKGGTYQYLLVRGHETWTGIDGPALYVYGAAQDITLDQALRLHGTDIRSRLMRAANGRR